MAAGTLCLCGAVLLQFTTEGPSSERVAVIVRLGVALGGVGLVGLAVRWPPGGAGRRAVAILASAPPAPERAPEPATAAAGDPAPSVEADLDARWRP